MEQLLVEEILGFPIQAGLVGLFLCIARPIGLTFGFMVMYWGVGRAVLLRMGFAAGLVPPIVAANYETVSVIIQTADLQILLGLLPKEFLIGLVFGLFSSLPFFAFQFAGAVIDNYRGESSSGIMAPTGGEVQTTSLLFLLIAILVFIVGDGLFFLVEDLYKTYRIWPIQSPLPSLSGDAVSIVMVMIMDMFILMLRVGLPLLMFMMITDLVLAIATKMGQKFGLFDMSFLLKNVLFILILPLISISVISIANEEILTMFTGRFLEVLFPQ